MVKPLIFGLVVVFYMSWFCKMRKKKKVEIFFFCSKLAGFMPFGGNATEEIREKVLAGKFKVPPWFTGGARNLLGKILEKDVNLRFTISDILNDEWFSKYLIEKKKKD